MSVDPKVSAATIRSMVAKYTATVVDGKLVLDAPTTGLPDGTKVDMSVDWSLEQLPAEGRAALLASIDEGLAQADRGEKRLSREEMRSLLLAQRQA